MYPKVTVIRKSACFTDGLSSSGTAVRKSGHFTDDLLESIPVVRKSGYFTDVRMIVAGRVH